MKRSNRKTHTGVKYNKLSTRSRKLSATTLQVNLNEPDDYDYEDDDFDDDNDNENVCEFEEKDNDTNPIIRNKKKIFESKKHKYKEHHSFDENCDGDSIKNQKQQQQEQKNESLNNENKDHNLFLTIPSNMNENSLHMKTTNFTTSNSSKIITLQQSTGLTGTTNEIESISFNGNSANLTKSKQNNDKFLRDNISNDTQSNNDVILKECVDKNFYGDDLLT